MHSKANREDKEWQELGCEVYVNGFVQHLLCGNCAYIDGDVEMASANNIISYVG